MLRDFRPGDRLKASTSCATVNDMSTNMGFDNCEVCIEAAKQKKHEWRYLSRKKNFCNDVHVLPWVFEEQLAAFGFKSAVL